MTNLTLTRAELTRLLVAFAWVTVLFAGLLVWVNAAVVKESPWAVVRYVSMGMTGATAALFVFVKWAWKWPWLARAMGRTVVHGVWGGRLKSDFQTDGTPQLDLPIVFIVRQTYLTLSIRSLTKSMRGSSTLETLVRDEKTEGTKLSYVYKLDQPWVPGGKKGAGAGELELESQDTVLRGMYWTDSPTHGTLRLQRLTDDADVIDTFDDALQKFPTLRAR